MKHSKSWWIIIVLMLIVTTIVTVLLWSSSTNQIRQSKMLTALKYEEYQYHFVMIAEEENSFWESVYESAKQSAKNSNAYLELLGANITAEYNQEDYLKIAIAEKVDGILIVPTGEEGVSQGVEAAVRSGIPVITMMEDLPQSQRQCFVGVSNYNLGQAYGKELLKLMEEDNNTKKETDILVLIPSEEETNSKNLIFSSMKEVIEDTWNIQAKSIEEKGPFSTEEAIRNIVKNGENIPDVLVCLNSVETECAYQAVVDYNKVGEIHIIGFFDSPTILDAIDKNIIYSSVAVDTRELGTASVESLMEYITEGRVTDFRTVEANIVNQSNVQQFLQKDRMYE